MGNREFVLDYAKQNFASACICIGGCIHDKKDATPRVHILPTMHPVEQGGSSGANDGEENVLAVYKNLKNLLIYSRLRCMILLVFYAGCCMGRFTGIFQCIGDKAFGMWSDGRRGKIR